MAREFNRNMFIMLLAIMIGAIIITYFIADIIRRSEAEIYEERIGVVISEKNIFENQSKNFTDRFIKSLGYLDVSREDRAEGNSYFDFAANIWYPNGQYQKVIDNCTLAMESYLIGNENFLNTKNFFNDALAYSFDVKYTNIINIYLNLSQSGANICLLRYNASLYLRNIAENLSLFGNETNVSVLLDLFNETNELYMVELGIYYELIEEIEDEYGKYFNPIREIA